MELQYRKNGFFLPATGAHSRLLPQGAGTNSEQTGRLLLRRAGQEAGLELQKTSLVPGLLNKLQCHSSYVLVFHETNKVKNSKIFLLSYDLENLTKGI